MRLDGLHTLGQPTLMLGRTDPHDGRWSSSSGSQGNQQGVHLVHIYGASVCCCFLPCSAPSHQGGTGGKRKLRSSPHKSPKGSPTPFPKERVLRLRSSSTSVCKSRVLESVVPPPVFPASQILRTLVNTARRSRSLGLSSAVLMHRLTISTSATHASF